MKILILGGAGYLGSVISIAAIRYGYSVTVIDNLSFSQANHQYTMSEISGGYYRFCHRDVRDYDYIKPFVTKADVIFPLAAIVGAPACDANPELAVEVNFKSIIELIKMLGVNQRIVFPNTNSGYGTTKDVCTEKTPLVPISLYGITKKNAEEAVMGRSSSTTLRLATVFGVSPRMRLDLLVNDLTYQAFFNKRLEIFEGQAMRNYIHIKDVAHAFLHCLERSATTGQVFNVGLDLDNMNKLKLAELVAELTGAEVVVGKGHDKDRRDCQISSHKFYKTGFIPQFYLTDGIEELLKFYKTFPSNRTVREQMTVLMRNAS
jgi:nucleoside-diphosphate-sugar epimerase